MPAPLEDYAREFDALFGKRNQREGFRRCLEAPLVPSERNKTLTALVNAEPIVSAQGARVQALRWFLSESPWDSAAVNRPNLLRAGPATASGGPNPPAAASSTWAARASAQRTLSVKPCLCKCGAPFAG